MDVLCEVIFQNSLADVPEPEVIPSLPTIETRAICDILRCQPLCWEDFKEAGLRSFRPSQTIMLKDLDQQCIERTNLDCSEIVKRVAGPLPDYVDCFRRGLSQPGLRRWLRRLELEPAL